MLGWILAIITVICITIFVFYWKEWITNAKIGWGALGIGTLSFLAGSYLVYRGFTAEGQLSDRRSELQKLLHISEVSYELGNDIEAQIELFLKHKSFLKEHGVLTSAEINEFEAGVADMDLVMENQLDLQETVEERQREILELENEIDIREHERAESKAQKNRVAKAENKKRKRDVQRRKSKASQIKQSRKQRPIRSSRPSTKKKQYGRKKGRKSRRTKRRAPSRRRSKRGGGGYDSLSSSSSDDDTVNVAKSTNLHNTIPNVENY